MQPMRVIQNTDLIKDRVRECIKLTEDDESNKSRFENELNEEYLTLDFIKFLKTFWNTNSKEKKIYLNELLTNNELFLPKYEEPPVDPEYQERMRKLRLQLDEEEYQRMVANVDLGSRYRKNQEKFSLFPEFKSLQGQLVTVFNVVATIGGAFAFGYKAIEYSLERPDFTKQIFGGFILAIIVAIADFYFLFKRLMMLDDDENKKRK